MVAFQDVVEVFHLPVPPCLLVQLKGVFLDPAADRGVIDWHAPLGHHFLQSAVAHPVAAVPPHRPQNDATRGNDNRRRHPWL